MYIIRFSGYNLSPELVQTIEERVRYRDGTEIEVEVETEASDEEYQ